MKFNITTRDFKFFLLGITAAFLLATIYNWEDNYKDIKDGLRDGKLKYGNTRNNY